MEGRNQFTFYRSFAEALRYIRKPSERAAAYDAICNYALYGVEPNLDELPDSAALAMAVIKPILDSGNRKARAGQQGGSKPKANGKQTESKLEANSKQEKEQEKEQEQDKEQMLIKRDPKQEAFERFWAVYPKKVGKEAARKAFAKVKVPVDTLTAAILAQKRSAQWTKDNGQYIPNPATWLNQGRWEDVLETPQEIAQGTDWHMGEEELAAIRALKRGRANA